MRFSGQLMRFRKTAYKTVSVNKKRLIGDVGVAFLFFWSNLLKIILDCSIK